VKTGSLRRRVVVATLALLAVVLTGFATAVTLRYRSSSQDALDQRLVAGARALGAADPQGAKQLIASLGLEGIVVHIEKAPGLPDKGGVAAPAVVKDATPSVAQRGSLLVVQQPVGSHLLATLTASRAPIDSAVWRLVALEAALAVVALVVGGALLVRATGAALRPLDHVGRVAREIAAGETSRRLRPERDDTELGRMAAAFDGMVDALEAAVARSQAAEEAMRRFLADASHELRTPVAALQATAETLLREQPQRPERDAIEARLARDSARLGRLVDDLLDLARLDARPQEHGEEVELASVALAAVEDARPPTEQVSLELTGADGARVRGDPGALRRVVRNLLDNAIAAVGPGGRVVVSVLRTGATSAEVVVEDDGPGVPAGDRDRVFERFVQLDPARGGGSAGLGLAIARRIARQHGGDVTCDEVSRGARFTVRLPALPLPS
jgi:signal transduction histidine kinase